LSDSSVLAVREPTGAATCCRDSQIFKPSECADESNNPRLFTSTTRVLFKTCCTRCPELKPQLLDELRAHLSVRRARARCAQSFAQITAGGEFASACGARLEVFDDILSGFIRQLFAEKRVGDVTKLTAPHRAHRSLPIIQG